MVLLLSREALLCQSLPPTLSPSLSPSPPLLYWVRLFLLCRIPLLGYASLCSISPFSCGYASSCSVTPFSCEYASLCSVTPSSPGYASFFSLGCTSLAYHYTGHFQTWRPWSNFSRAGGSVATAAATFCQVAAPTLAYPEGASGTYQHSRTCSWEGVAAQAKRLDSLGSLTWRLQAS